MSSSESEKSTRKRGSLAYNNKPCVMNVMSKHFLMTSANTYKKIVRLPRGTQNFRFHINHYSTDIQFPFMKQPSPIFKTKTMHLPGSSKLQTPGVTRLIFIHGITFPTTNHPNDSFQILHLAFSKFPSLSLPLSISNFTHFTQFQAPDIFQMSSRLLLDEF